MKLSILICTYNRSDVLTKCLECLLPQLKNEIEILVIDNASSDDTKSVVNNLMYDNYKIKYFFEANLGLSYARNRGILESKSEWVLFIDDDAIAFPNLIDRALYLIETSNYDCIGGKYFGYFLGEKPKWLPNDFESYKGDEVELMDCEYSKPIGCIVLYKKNKILEAGGFNTQLGMKGKNIAYSEETEIQLKMKLKGCKFGFDPNLKVNHLIRNDKKKLLWHLKSSFAHGRDSYFNKSDWSFLFILLRNLLSLFSLLFRRLPYNFFKLIFKNNYYWQNVIIDSLHGNLYYFGLVVSYRKNAKTYPASYKTQNTHLP